MPGRASVSVRAFVVGGVVVVVVVVAAVVVVNVHQVVKWFCGIDDEDIDESEMSVEAQDSVVDEDEDVVVWSF